MKTITLNIEDDIYNTIENLGSVIHEAIEKAYGKSLDVSITRNDAERDVDDADSWLHDTINDIMSRHPGATCKSFGGNAVYYEWTMPNGERNWNVYYKL